MRHYAPNSERDIVISCGCIVTGWGQVKILGSGDKWYQLCEAHPDGPGKWGMQKVLREASLSESVLFREWRTPATKRRSKRAYNEMLKVLGCYGETARPESESPGNGRLF